MNIHDIENQRITVSARSITVKDENGKTRGVIRGITALSDIQPNRQIEYSGKLRKAGISRELMMRYLDKILVVDGELFFPVDDYQYNIAFRLGERYVSDVEEFAQAMTVIHCARIHWGGKKA